MANSMGALPLKVTCVFLTVAVFRINWVVVWRHAFRTHHVALGANFEPKRVLTVTRKWQQLLRLGCCAKLRVTA